MIHQRAPSHKGNTAVAADCNLRLIGIDEDLWMSRRTPASLAHHSPVMSPPHRLLVDHLHR